MDPPQSHQQQHSPFGIFPVSTADVSPPAPLASMLAQPQPLVQQKMSFQQQQQQQHQDHQRQVLAQLQAIAAMEQQAAAPSNQQPSQQQLFPRHFTGTSQPSAQYLAAQSLTDRLRDAHQQMQQRATDDTAKVKQEKVPITSLAAVQTSKPTPSPAQPPLSSAHHDESVSSLLGSLQQGDVAASMAALAASHQSALPTSPLLHHLSSQSAQQQQQQQQQLLTLQLLQLQSTQQQQHLQAAISQSLPFYTTPNGSLVPQSPLLNSLNPSAHPGGSFPLLADPAAQLALSSNPSAHMLQSALFPQHPIPLHAAAHAQLLQQLQFPMQAHAAQLQQNQGQHPERFQCPTCHRSYARREHLSRHLRSHKSKKHWFQCTKCTRRFYRRDHLNYHLTSHDISPRYVCAHSTCEKAFVHKRDLIRHQSDSLHFGILYGQMGKDGQIVIEQHEEAQRTTTDMSLPDGASSSSAAEAATGAHEAAMMSVQHETGTGSPADAAPITSHPSSGQL